MTQKPIFEIPIYSMSEKKFEALYNSIKLKKIQWLVSCGHPLERAEEIIHNSYYPQNIWNYNQIVGYVTISISTNDIWFNAYLTADKRLVAISKTKHFMSDLRMNGTHFPICRRDTDTNEKILTEIYSWLKMIEKEHLKNKFYVDLRAFDNVAKFIDYMALANSII